MRNFILLFIMLFITSVSGNAAIVPHTAYYKVKMIGKEKGIPIKDVSGVMYMKLNNVCDGWTIEQKSSSRAELSNAAGQKSDQDLDSIYAVWESTDGSNFNFSSRRIQNKESLMDVSGDSIIKKQKTSIVFKQPETTTMEANTPVLFPIKHLEKQLQAIKDGKTEISTTVFDGSSYGEPVIIKTKIDPNITKCKFVDKDNKVHEMDTHALVMGVFAPGSDTPNFIIKQQMSDKGVMCKYEIDFETYAIGGELAEIVYIDNKKQCA